MRLHTATFFSGLVLTASFSRAADFPAAKMYDSVRLADGIFAFLSPESKTGVVSGNVVAVVGENGVLVVDSGRFPTLARRMIAEIRRVTKKPVKYLVHTHWHADHVLGDEEFRAEFPDVAIVSTGFTRAKIAEQGPKGLREIAEKVPPIVQDMRDRLRGGKRRDGTPYTDSERSSLEEEIRDLDLYVSEAALARPVVPDVAFENSLVVDLGGREVRVLFLGRGNTAGDTVVFVPDANVVATGDLLVYPTPYGHGCYPGEWIETLRRLIQTGATTVVPGHGPVFHDWAYAKKLVGLLEALETRVGEEVRKGATLKEVRERVTLEEFVEPFAGQNPARAAAFRAFFVPSAIERAYQEAKGSFADENAVSPE
jgi:cyclase